MRLSEDKARRLSSLVWRERARRVLPLALAAVVIAVGFTALLLNQMGRADRTLEVKTREGTVVHVKSAQRGAAIMTVHLDDGQDVDAFSALRIMPPAGTHVLINEARHASGRLTYDIQSVVD